MEAPFFFPFSCLPVFLLLTVLSTNYWSQFMLAQGDRAKTTNGADKRLLGLPFSIRRFASFLGLDGQEQNTRPL